jgi:hypothetical protein
MFKLPMSRTEVEVELKAGDRVYVIQVCTCTVHHSIGHLIKQLRGRTVSKVVVDNFANFLSISPNQTKFFSSLLLGPNWTFLLLRIQSRLCLQKGILYTCSPPYSPFYIKI